MKPIAFHRILTKSVATIFKGRNRVLIPLRIYIGGLFIYASLHKIEGPSNFAGTVASFELLPYWSVNAVAIILPWIEFWSGVFLVLGVFVRSSALTVCALLSVFFGATLVNVIRGSNIDCGCFVSDKSQPITYWTVTRDAAWLAMAVTIFILERRVLSLRRPRKGNKEKIDSPCLSPVSRLEV
jgi:putative oxidoreductase